MPQTQRQQLLMKGTESLQQSSGAWAYSRVFQEEV